ncbi:hypothetical protein L1887_28877 [Cichorium endivia]|nr:hypothetical protein L1887_28877 [Cichorium endivia]
MEISVENSGGSKTNSLDLKTLYKSEVINKGESVFKGTSSWQENGEGDDTKKRKSRKEVAVSSFEDLAERKRIKHSIDDDIEVDEADSSSAQSSGLGQNINGGGGLNAIGINIVGDSHGVLIPKRQRSKFSKSHLLKPSDSVEKVTELKDEPNEVLQDDISPEQIIKLNDKPVVEDITKHLSVVDSKIQESTTVTSSSLGSKDEDVKEIDEISLGSKDQVSILKKETDEISQSSNSTSADQISKLNGNNVNQTTKVDIVKSEGTDFLLNKKDSSSTRIKTNHRKRKYLGSKLESSVEKKDGTCDLDLDLDLDPDDDLEQNAARMLSSRFDPSCIGFASKNRTSALESVSEKPTSSDPDNTDRVLRLRPRRQQKGKGISRKRRHFYEVHSDDMDAHWFLNRRIKIFWPLDESWYYGLVNDYDAEKNLHHIKYDDRDEEWISLENERFKLLLLPNEVPHKDTDSYNKGTRSFNIKDDAFMATQMESEPIISWLARSSHRVKSKKQKQSHFSNGNTERETDNKPNCTSVFLNSSEGHEHGHGHGHLPIVYVRRRNRRFTDASCVPFVAWSLIESKKFEIHISLWPMLKYVLGADTLWLFSRVLLLQYGTIVTMWPSVFLEVLFVDNIVGLRLFLFEGCLKQAVTFVFLVMKVFCESDKDDYSVDQKVPVTSIRFKLSFLNSRKQTVFAYYSFSKVKESNWRYLDSKFQPHCLLTKQLSLPECTYENVKLLESGTQPKTANIEVLHKKSNPGSRPSTIYGLKNGNLPPFALSFSSSPNFFLSLHLKLLLERSITLQEHADNDSEIFSIKPSLEPPAIDNKSSSQLVLDPISNVNTPSISPKLKRITVEIPNSDEAYRDCQPGADVSDGSPNPTAPRNTWHRNKPGSGSSSFIDGKTDFIGNGFGVGPKKPRTQVQYTLPSFNFKNKGHNSQTGLPYQRIRKANEKKTSDPSKGPRRNLELVACDANILINGGDKGWREHGARVFLEVADHNEWKLAVKLTGVLKYAYKVHQDLQPGSTNRYTHAMMWKGGKDWALEFPDRSQWFLFKEMHEECHNRNIRAASIKNIPIPGVRLIRDSVDDEDETVFVRSSWYIRQVRNDAEMAMDASRVMYDMDSEDEEWVCRSRGSEEEDESQTLTDEVFEKVMDMLEKVSFAQKRDNFTSGEIEELIARITPVKLAKTIYQHWREKRQRKGMPLIRQLQPPLWERYQQICREWDQSHPKLTTGAVSGSHSHSQEKTSSAGDNKPPMFAFCLKPRGLELLNKGSKHRPHKKISLSGHSHAFLGDHDTHHSSGRRVNTYGFGDDRGESSDVSPLLSRMYSPRDLAGPGHFVLDGDTSEWNHQLRLQRTTSKTVKPLVSPKPFRKAGKRNNGKKPNTFPDWHNHNHNHNHPSPPYRHLGGSDLDEFRLRDASSAAKHARNMAKLKRERAQKLMLSADLAIHKAVSALMTAEAIKAMNE